ncbi:hypothetical protein L2E82_12185 [Cichorium intybus]|uniref:Uncharacterized protein n=1 Tax=Cichorium intybus TaxID=13427 RepID=A0ACB9GFA1_CICIN|nr:hypothetical protein L2E82_12185 [Cichorium intybus]
MSRCMMNITHFLRHSLFVAIILFLLGVASPMESMNLEANKSSSNVVHIDVGLLLDSSWNTKVLLKSFIEMAHSDFYATHSMYSTRLSLRTLYSSNAIDAVSAVVELLNGQVKAILGPKSIVEAIFITELGEKSHVPIISFDNASYSHLHIQRPYLIRNAMANSFVAPIIALMKGFKWDKIAFVYEHGMVDTDIFPNLRDSFQTHGIHIITTHELSVYGSWAYAIIWALATGIEDIKNEDLSFVKANNSQNGGEISQLGISRVGHQLLKVINKTRIRGLNAKLSFSRDELATYQIFNLDGGQRIIGYWSPVKGISRELDSNDNLEYSTSVENLKTIIWPGETTNKPIGWILPKKGKKLRVAVPKKIGFTQFVKVERNNDTNEINVTGFCIDLFEEALKHLPFKVYPEYIPFMNSSGQSNGTYDDLLNQLQSKTVDAVVGDTTIMFNRSEYVDFTMPYSDPGSVMLVPIKDDNVKGMWVFIRPLNWDLWCTIAGACVFVGLAIHILERNGNLAPWKFGLFFWFPILILAFPERKIVENNWSRFVLVIWLFMAYIIMQGYTASLSAILTIEQLQPSRTNFSCIGYSGSSFVKDILTQSLKYEESQLRHYETMHDYASGLKNGCQNGGIDAIFNELPYIRLFMLTYGPKYMVVGRTYRTNGFGFAFPLGSPLVPYMSRAILNITESDMMQTLETSHFGTKYSSQDFNPQISPKAPGLNAYNFAGLFIITAFATIIALLCSESSFGKKYALKVKNYAKKRGSYFSSSQVIAIEDGDPVSRTDVSTNIGLPTHNHQDDANTHTLLYVEADGDSIIEEVELTIRHNRCLSL